MWRAYKQHSAAYPCGQWNKSSWGLGRNVGLLPVLLRSPQMQAGAAVKTTAHLTAQLEEGGEARHCAIAALRGNVCRLSLESAGCRVVQLALKVAGPHQAASVAAELQGHVWKNIKSPHGNFVIQEMIKALPIAHWSFVVPELLGYGSSVARHFFGFKILCCLVKHSSADTSITKLLDEVLLDASWLITHHRGSRVMQALLESGGPEQRHRIAMALSGNLIFYASDRHGSQVVKKALEHCCAEDQHMLALELLADCNSNELSRFEGSLMEVLAGWQSHSQKAQADGRTLGWATVMDKQLQPGSHADESLMLVWTC